jgi:tripartite-type tricarboxylate transporter receptor subunit TctC
VVENKAGAGGWLAIQHVQKATPDGYTLMANGSITVDMPLFNKEARFKPGTDVQAVGAVFYAPYVMFTNTQVPVKNLREFIAYVKANPGKLNWAVAPNTGQHLDTYGFIKGNGLDMVIVPYQGGAANLRAVLNNEAQAYFGAAFGLEPQVKAGKITLLGVTSAGRFPLLPDVPSIKEAIGYDLDSVVEYGFFTTFGAPKAVVEKLEKEIHDIMAKTDVKEQIEKQGYAMRLLTAEQWTQSMTKEFARASAIAQAAGIKPE